VSQAEQLRENLAELEKIASELGSTVECIIRDRDPNHQDEADLMEGLRAAHHELGEAHYRAAYTLLPS